VTRVSIGVCAVLFFVVSGDRAMSLEQKPVVIPFGAGQVWHYKARAQEPASRVLILLVERDAKLGEIVHIRVSGLHLKGPKGETSQVGHLPYEGKSLRSSVTTLESRDNPVPPDYQGGYKAWKGAFDSGKAGVFTAPLAEVLNGLEKGSGGR
jgi:hypothetical protein